MTQNNQNNTPPLEIADFDRFYEALYGYKPFRWQSRLAQQICIGCWPDYLKLPTSSGKTAAIDIAVFALAYQACPENRPSGVVSAARRIFFVVDRRIIVNEAYRRASKMAKRLWEALATESPDSNSIEYRVASWLQYLTASANAPPLDCFELRGGIYKNDAWVRSPLQPTVLTSTVDQVGSRMLFRGYGVSDRNLPIHASLTTHDSIVILDEAHCSHPFSQTVESIKRYRSAGWSEQQVNSPFSLVQMTATPPKHLGERNVFSLDGEDYLNDSILKQRHVCSKPTRLELAATAKGKALPLKLAKQLVLHATGLVDRGCTRIAIVVNRVAIARLVYEELGMAQRKKFENDRWLMIGRMRPYDRDKLTEEIQSRFGSGVPFDKESPQFVIATQCLEVGADLNFDGMVTQCASLDALRQRFGRLNRLGDAPQSCGVIVAAQGDVPDLAKLKEDDPHDSVYGNALAYTWYWLDSIAKNPDVDAQLIEAEENVVSTKGGINPLDKEVDFGISALDELIDTNPVDTDLAPPAKDAPVLMPAHLDMLCQTSPRPTPEPNVAFYLHGTDTQLAEVRVCWRADLDLESSTADPSEVWTKAVAACPPTAAELLSVPMSLFKKWLKGETAEDLSSDVLGERESIDESVDEPRHIESTPKRCALAWRGEKSKVNHNSNESKRGFSFVVDYRSLKLLNRDDTIVIPAEFGGWANFGYVPNAPVDPALHLGEEESTECEVPAATIDVADVAYGQGRARSILRVHAKLAEATHEDSKPLFDAILSRLLEANAADKGIDANAIKHHVKSINSSNELPNLLCRLLDQFQKLELYPGGVVWSTLIHKDMTGGFPKLPLMSFDDDETSLETSKLSLLQHLADVRNEAKRLTDFLELGELAPSLLAAATLHDVGKADPRFQAMLLNKPLSVS